MYRSLGTVGSLLGTVQWPVDFFQPDDLPAFLDRIYVLDYRFQTVGDGMLCQAWLGFEGELAVGLPGLDGVQLVAGGGDVAGMTFANATLAVGSESYLRIQNVRLALRFDPTILQPASLSPDEAPLPFVEVQIEGSITIDSNFDVTVEGFDGLRLTPAMIGNSGVIVAAQEVKLDLSRTSALPEVLAAGFDESFLGVFIGEAQVHLPEGLPALAPEDLVLRDCAIGSGGVSGRLEAHYSPVYDPGTRSFSGTGAGELFGVPFGLQDVTLEFRQNALTESAIAGQLVIPFFDEPVDTVISLDAGGGLNVGLASAGGLYTLTKPGVLSIELESIGFELEDGLFVAKLSGAVTPLVAGLDWPTFHLNELSIDSEGNVRVDGGWLDLPDQYALNLYGFQLEISKLGLGRNENGSKWLGLSGGLKLVDGLQAGASVEGLRITWMEGSSDPPSLTLNGVGVEFEVPEVLKFKGAVSYRELEVDGETVHRFDGDIQLQLTALDLVVDATLVIGTATGPDGTYTFFAIYLAAELPAGIPLWATGLGLYGMAGLFALQMEPDKQPDEEWYEGWYKRPDIGVTDLKKKWTNREGSLALGAGVTIGTVADNGFTFAGKMLLAIVFPGPILMIEGKANLLQERAKLNDEPTFRALAVLDARAGSLLVGLDAQYKYAGGGELIDIHGGAEAYFDFDDASQWHLYLGEKEPREKRIRAEIFKLFEANAYFMLDANMLQTGAWIGYDKHWQFGPLRVGVEAWIEGNTVVSWKPVHFYGDLWLHGKAELSVYGFGLSLTADARIAADVFDPYHLLGEFSVGINLPWPLPDFDVSVTLEWGPEPTPPALPLPLKEVAVEHFKVSTSWALERGTHLLPDYEGDPGFLVGTDPGYSDTSPAPANLPVVPLDGRPHLSFGRTVHDDALVGVNAQAVTPAYERLGDPSKNEGPVKVRYGLKEVALDKWTGSKWEPMARKAADPNPAGVETLFGSWAAVPNMPDGGGVNPGQNKLWLWSPNAFSFTRHSGRAWEEWFTSHFDHYPCIPQVPNDEVCCDFAHVDPKQAYVSPYRCEKGGMTLSWLAPKEQYVTKVDPPVEGLTQAFCFPSTVSQGPEQPVLPNRVTIELDEPTDSIRLLVVDQEGVEVTWYDVAGKQFGPIRQVGTPNNPLVEVTGHDLVRVEFRPFSRACLLRICYGEAVDPAEVIRREELAKHLVEETARWYQQGYVLEPHTIYRLKTVTTVDATGEGALSGYAKNLKQTEYAFFQTDGPPALATLSKECDLNDLTRYVRQTVPPTVPDAGEKPPLPRPVYRAYDTGVEFNEDYVDLMYRMEQRDLGLYLYDNNNQPVRDAEGRLVVLSNQWGRTEDLTLTASEQLLIRTFNDSGCALIDEDLIPRDATLGVGQEGLVLEADTLYEARLVPMLLHESFSQYTVGAAAVGTGAILGRWQVADQGASAGPSRWEVKEAGSPPARYVVQTTDVWDGTWIASDPVKPGTSLLYGDNDWTDYRFSAYLRSEDDDAIGVLFRYQNASNCYRFSMDRQRQYRRLVRIAGGVHTVLAEDAYAYSKDQDYLITVEAVGSSLRVYQDGELLFDVTDSTFAQGTIGLYCWGNAGARFSDVRVDDFRAEAPVAYRYRFTTSQYATFVHHLHSYLDETWRVELADVSGVAALVSKAQAPSAAITDAEGDAYDSLVELAIGQAARQNPPAVEVTRLEHSGDPLALLVRSPEPIDWARTSLTVLQAPEPAPQPDVPGVVKLTDVTFGATQPNEESVTLLLQEAASLEGCEIQARAMPGALASLGSSEVLFADGFDGDAAGLLFAEAFEANALDAYTILDEGNYDDPSAWAVSGGQIVQTSNIHYSASGSADDADKPGTMAITGEPSWADVRMTAVLYSGDNDAIGLVFRYQDADNYYRWSMDEERQYRRLIKKVGGTVTVLWEEKAGYTPGRAYTLVVETCGDRLLGYLDNALVFNVEDASLASGRIGLYCWANKDAAFRGLTVEALDSLPVLWEPALADLSEFEAVDAAGATEGPSAWAAADGVVTQTANIQVAGSAPDSLGTYLVGGDSTWTDVQIHVRLSSGDDDAIGLMFRYQDDDNYYRFSMDSSRTYRRLIKKVGGVVTVLWETATGYTVGRSYDLTIRAAGAELQGWLNGDLQFAVSDGDLAGGRLALYCWANVAASFERLLVTDPGRTIGQWTIVDEGTASGPSVWKVAGGSLLQTADIYSADAPAYSGTYAVAGEAAWTDYRYTVELRSDDDDAIGLLFRYVDRENYYRFGLNAQSKVRQLIRKAGGVVTVLWQDAIAGFQAGVPFTMTVDAVGSRLVGYAGVTKLFDVTDATHSAGKVGLWCWQNTGARFDRAEVARPPLEAYALLRDQFSAGSMAGWTTVDEGSLSGPSVWSVSGGCLRQTSNIHTLDAPVYSGTYAVAGDAAWADVILQARLQSADDDAIGLLLRYQDKDNYYRFAMDRERSYRSLVRMVGGTLEVLWEDEFAFELGQAYGVTVVAEGSSLRGYLDGVPMFAVTDGKLEKGQVGLYCWANTGASFSEVRVYPASAGFADWLLNDQAGRSFTPGTDSVASSESVYAVAGEADWTDYRVSVRLRPDDELGIGVLFRYRDAANHYAFYMDQKVGARRLISRVDGTVQVLWEEAAGYKPGRDYIMTVDCFGSRLTGYLDGVKLFAVDDATFAEGQVGLYCDADMTAQFDEIRVSEPVWETWYRFGAEERLPAGARVRVYSGSEEAAPMAEANLAYRFAAGVGESGSIRLAASGADLRVVDAGGAAGHARRFLPSSAYSAVAAKVLRKQSDGTDFFVVVPAATTAGTQLAEGQYRLSLVYRRNVAGLQVLSQAGDTSDEQVVLDIPWAARN